MTMIDVKECAIDRSGVVVHIRPFKLLKTLYGFCFRLAKKIFLLIQNGGSILLLRRTHDTVRLFIAQPQHFCFLSKI